MSGSEVRTEEKASLGIFRTTTKFEESGFEILIR